MKLSTLLLAPVLALATPAEDAARDTLTAWLGDLADSFILEQDPDLAPMSFTISSSEGKVKITADSGVSLTTGAYDYLKSNDNMVSWTATGGDR